jgi:hypothetical protein
MSTPSTRSCCRRIAPEHATMRTLDRPPRERLSWRLTFLSKAFHKGLAASRQPLVTTAGCTPAAAQSPTTIFAKSFTKAFPKAFPRRRPRPRRPRITANADTSTSNARRCGNIRGRRACGWTEHVAVQPQNSGVASNHARSRKFHHAGAATWGPTSVWIDAHVEAPEASLVCGIRFALGSRRDGPGGVEQRDGGDGPHAKTDRDDPAVEERQR